MKARFSVFFLILAIVVSACSNAASPTATATPTEIPATATPTEIPATATATEIPPTSTPTEIPPTSTPVLSPEEQEAMQYDLDLTCEFPELYQVPSDFAASGGLNRVVRLKYDSQQIPEGASWGDVIYQQGDKNVFIKWDIDPAVKPAILIGCASIGDAKHGKSPWYVEAKVIQWFNTDGSSVLVTMLSPNGVSPKDALFPVLDSICPWGIKNCTDPSSLLREWIATDSVPKELESISVIGGLY